MVIESSPKPNNLVTGDIDLRQITIDRQPFDRRIRTNADILAPQVDVSANFLAVIEWRNHLLNQVKNHPLLYGVV